EENLTEDDVILKWDGDSDNYGWWAFDNGVAAPVPFGLYERNPATGEETRLIPVLFSNDHTEGVFDISSSTPDVFSDFPATDWVYAYRFDPSIATYEEWVQDARDGQIHTDPTTDELFARLIFASDTERLPATGTVIQFSTNKSGIVAGSGFEGAVPIAWERPESAPCFTPEYDVFRDGRQIATTARLDYLDGAIPVDDEPYAYQIRARHPVTGETSELTAVKIAEPHAGGFAATSGLCVVPPTIDGSIGAQEWAAATVIEAGPYPGSPAARLLVMNNRTFLYLALDDAASAEAVEIYLDANGDGHYGMDALEGRIVLDHGALRFVRLIGEYPDVSEIETIENPVWLAAAATGGSAEIRLTLTVGPLRDRPATDTVSLFARAPEGVAAYPPGPVVVLSQAPRLFAKIQLADASALPGFSELPHPTPVIGQDLSFAVALDVVPEARVSCLYRSPQSVAGLHEVAVAHPETAIELRPNERGAYQVTIPAAAITPSGISYRIQVVEPDGRVRRSDPVLLTTATLAIAASSENEDLALLFADLSTSTSFPNPFQGTTTIAFRVPVEQSVSAGIYDVGGKRVRELRRNETLTAGVHTVVWDGRNDAGRAVATGIYYYRITGGDFRYTRPISFLR
ncbi:MAG: T9SS type A sorting domain-containing protein, partial [Candidatus Eisenbacteria bacterium]|nr:T9SS type A sorting domain-containing protein [Candidatus Eisenbacteria bacterium]